MIWLLPYLGVLLELLKVNVWLWNKCSFDISVPIIHISLWQFILPKTGMGSTKKYELHSKLWARGLYSVDNIQWYNTFLNNFYNGFYTNVGTTDPVNAKKECLETLGITTNHAALYYANIFTDLLFLRWVDNLQIQAFYLSIHFNINRVQV